VTCGLTSRRSQPPLALAVPLSRFTSRVGGGSAFYVRQHRAHEEISGHFGWLDFRRRIGDVCHFLFCLA